MIRQKNEEKQNSQKYMKESLSRPNLSSLQSINEENPDDLYTNLANENNATTYKRSFQNYYPRSTSSFDLNNNNNNANKHDELNEDNDEDNNYQKSRPRSASLTKKSKTQTPLKRSISSFQQKPNIESLQINDDDDDEQETQSTILPPIKPKESFNQDEDAKTRKIRQLKNRLSRQEEEAKKQLNELQSKQSRLENALKLLTKQTPSVGKRRSQNTDNTEKESEHQPVRSYSSLWRPDTSTIHRLQEN